MMPAILFSSRTSVSENIASNNMALELMKLGFEQKTENEWRHGNAKLIDTKFDRALNVPTDFEAGYLIVLSPHRSEAELRSLTAHIPGNWDRAEHGGQPRTLNIAFASMQKSILRKMHEKNAKYGFGFNVNYEVDHHGPTIGKPIIFVEIGSSENEWKNPLAAKIAAEVVFEATSENETENGKPETFFGVGGGHYAPKFTKLALEKGMAFGHMLPKYRADSVAEDTFRQAIEKNVEEVEKIMVDKKGVNKGQREKVEKLAKEFGVEISEV